MKEAPYNPGLDNLIGHWSPSGNGMDNVRVILTGRYNISHKGVMRVQVKPDNLPSRYINLQSLLK